MTTFEWPRSRTPRNTMPRFLINRNHEMTHACTLSHFSRVQLFVTLWTLALQAPLSMRFSRKEYWSGLPCVSPGEYTGPRGQTHISYISCLGRWILYHKCHLGSPFVTHSSSSKMLWFLSRRSIGRRILLGEDSEPAAWNSSSSLASCCYGWFCRRVVFIFQKFILGCAANLENSAVATGLEKVSFHSNPKERQCQRMLKLLHNCTQLTC